MINDITVKHPLNGIFCNEGYIGCYSSGKKGDIAFCDCGFSLDFLYCGSYFTAEHSAFFLNSGGQKNHQLPVLTSCS